MSHTKSMLPKLPNRDRNFTPHKLAKRMQQVEESIARYMDALDTADRT